MCTSLPKKYLSLGKKKETKKVRNEAKQGPPLTMFTVGGEEAEVWRSSSSFQKGVQLIKNRTTHTNNELARTHTASNIHHHNILFTRGAWMDR